MVKGILDSEIVEDGGAKCYAEIPKAYHVIVGVISVFIHFTISKKWAPHLVNPHIQYSIKPNVVEKIFAIFGIVSLVLTCLKIMRLARTDFKQNLDKPMFPAKNIGSHSASAEGTECYEDLDFGQW